MPPPGPPRRAQIFRREFSKNLLNRTKKNVKMIHSAALDLPTPRQIEDLIHKCNFKYKLIVSLMADAGLRVSEVVRLQVKHFNFRSRTITVESLKKREGETKRGRFREIPLTARIIQWFTEYWKRAPIDREDPDAFIFPAGKGSEQDYLSRKRVWRRLKKHSDGAIKPHALRHSFATRVVNEGNDIGVAQKLLGHKSRQTTEIYLHVGQAAMARAIESIEEKPTVWQKIGRAIVPRKQQVDILPMTKGMTSYHVGRKVEISRIAYLAERKVNTIIMGPQGVGKTHLLDSFCYGNVIRIDDLRAAKRVLGGLLLELFQGDKKEVMRLLMGVEDEAGFQRVATKESIKRLTELACQVTQKGEYTLVIDDLTDVTKTGVGVLEKLKNHFHIVAAARRIKVDHATFLSNFEKVELKSLTRPEANELIVRASQDFKERIDDWEMYKNRIWEDTNGVPLYILEMIDRFKKEPIVSAETLQSTKHTAAKQEVDFTIILLLIVSSLVVLRYVGAEIGENSGAYKLLGGAALVIAVFARSIFRALRRKYV